MFELFESSVANAALWFVIGVFCYRLIRTLTNYVHGVSFIRQINELAIRLLTSVEKDLVFIQTIKYRQMLEAGLSEKNIRLVRELDENFIKNWQVSCINSFFSIYPPKMWSTIPFKTWEEALRLVEDTYLRAHAIAEEATEDSDENDKYKNIDKNLN